MQCTSQSKSEGIIHPLQSVWYTSRTKTTRSFLPSLTDLVIKSLFSDFACLRLTK